MLPNWLKNYNARHVQYMAVQKYMSIIEIYQLNNLKGSKNRVEKFHPLCDN